MRNKSVIYCYVFGGLILIGAVTTATLIEDHSVRYFDESAKKKIDKSFIIFWLRIYGSKMKVKNRNSCLIK